MEKQEGRTGIISLCLTLTAAIMLAACGGDSSSEAGAMGGGGESSSSAESSNSSVQTSSSAGASSSSLMALSSSTPFSSSIEKISSSSAGLSSSSYSKVAWDYLNPNITYGEMTDSRDGQTYKTVVIGTQTWIAQNLNYADSLAMPNLARNSWCYGKSADSCAKYGRLYTWTGAMDIDSSYQSAAASAVISSPQQGVCPTGWHVPTDAEWTTLEEAAGGWSSAGTALKSTSGWYNDGNGTDTYGFSALPAVDRRGAVDFYNAGNSVYFWSAAEYDAYDAYVNDLNCAHADTNTYNDYKSVAFSVRCVKD